MKYTKVYVEMNCNIKPDGFMRPVSMILDNGRDRAKFVIDRVLDVRKAAALKAGGVGLRYTVRIKGHEKFLWYENPAWFIEVLEGMIVI